MSVNRQRVLVLDAMGVLYRHADDVDDLLVPFIAEAGGSRDVRLINARYLEASLGNLTAPDFWAAVGLDASVEDRYLARHELFPGLLPFLLNAQRQFTAIACLSNDVDVWSRKLRQRHGLTEAIGTWVVSGDYHIRKPSPGIYRGLLERLGVAGEQILFVDDRPANLDAARRFGMRTLWMVPAGVSDGNHEVVRSLEDVLRWQNSQR